MGDNFVFGPEESPEFGDRLLQVIERRRVPDVSHVGGGDGKPPSVNRRVRVQFGADAEDAARPESIAVRFGAIPLERRRISPSRITQSSTRFVMVRSWTRK